MDLRKAADHWVLTQQQFEKGLVGGKSLKINEMLSSLPRGVVTPVAMALPYGCFQKALADPTNAKPLAALEGFLQQLAETTDNATVDQIFGRIRGVMRDVSVPAALLATLGAAAAKESSLARLLEEAGEKAAALAITQVWSSLFGMRPWVSLTKAGWSYHDLNMAVLVQNVLPASFSFVTHTRNPFGSADSNELYGEVVAGMGETLVGGNYPGRALSWKMKRGTGAPQVVAFPSKSAALRAGECLIFRSDSNGEDLDNFAGAGLFESVTTRQPDTYRVQYHKLKLVRDAAYRSKLLAAVSELSFAIEDHFGVPMDIEGVVLHDGETLGVVQARPQIIDE
eukprot:GHVU01218994.1.p3 GENE.GHVU01218994.1~~GHVU01218994.1.p3  ORF type:complete len:339 (+),score=92.07 GHVU01218994.1:299-1315(+)